MVNQLISLIQAYERDIKPQVKDEDELIQIGACLQILMEKCVRYNGVHYPDLILKIYKEEINNAKTDEQS